MKKRSLIVIDGIDGSGKATQVELLRKYFLQNNIDHLVIAFPRYEDNIYGDLVRRYLEGEFGQIWQIDPYLVSLIYAGDRALAKKEINEALDSGKIVICDRYVSSSKAHLAANLAEESEERRARFIKWLDNLEYEVNKVPREDLTVFLNVTPKMGKKLSEGKDIHEDSLRHLEEAGKVYLKLAKENSNWKVIECMRDGKLRNPEDIHQEIVKVLQDYIPL